MSQAYLRQKAKQALTTCSGNRRDATVLLQSWAETDERLKRALVSPVMRNLCALAIQRVAAPSAAASGGPAAADPDHAVDEMLRALGSREAHRLTSPRPAAAPPPPAGSPGHETAVRSLAAAFKPRRPASRSR